jgi:hypothetical protein
MHASSAAIYRGALSAALIAAVLAMFSFSLAYAETGGRLPLLFWCGTRTNQQDRPTITILH